MKLLLILVLVLLAVAWWYQRRRQSRAEQAGRERADLERRQISQKSSRYHAVSIRLGRTACRAAAELEGKRFLSASAPQLPLPDCDAAECDCRFAHHKDRRAGNDRRDPFGSGGVVAGTGSFEEERRQGRDRRKQDDDEYLF